MAVTVMNFSSFFFFVLRDKRRLMWYLGDHKQQLFTVHWRIASLLLIYDSRVFRETWLHCLISLLSDCLSFYWLHDSFGGFACGRECFEIFFFTINATFRTIESFRIDLKIVKLQETTFIYFVAQCRSIIASYCSLFIQLNSSILGL